MGHGHQRDMECGIRRRTQGRHGPSISPRSILGLTQASLQIPVPSTPLPCSADPCLPPRTVTVSGGPANPVQSLRFPLTPVSPSPVSPPACVSSQWTRAPGRAWNSGQWRPPSPGQAPEEAWAAPQTQSRCVGLPDPASGTGRAVGGQTPLAARCGAAAAAPATKPIAPPADTWAHKTASRAEGCPPSPY